MAVPIAIVLVIYAGFLPRIASVSEVRHVLGEMTWLEVGTLALVAVWNLITYWVLLVATVPGLTLRQAALVTQASTALANTLPGGPAFGLALAYRMYASWGFRRIHIAHTLLVSGAGDIFAKLVMPLTALVALAIYGEATAPLITAAIVGLVLFAATVTLFALALSSDRAARAVGEGVAALATHALRLVGRPAVTGWGDAASRFRKETAGIMRGGWMKVGAAALVSHFSLYLVLLVALRHVGVSEKEVGWAEVLGAFAVVRLLSALPITPGGLGVVELGLTGALVVAGGEQVHVLAGVLVFRAVTYLLQIPLGGIAYALWERSVRRGSKSQALRSAGAETGGDGLLEV